MLNHKCNEMRGEKGATRKIYLRNTEWGRAEKWNGVGVNQKSNSRTTYIGGVTKSEGAKHL